LFILLHPFKAIRHITILYHFRKDREHLRELDTNGVKLDEKQYDITAERLKLSKNYIKEIVEEWIYKLPLPYLKKSIYNGVEIFIKKCKNNNLLLGAYSDYPVDDKLETLGLKKYMDLSLCSTDPEINAFKPSTRGLELALTKWKVPSQNVLYIGDRLDVDAACAAKLGMPFVLVGKKLNSTDNSRQVGIRDYNTLIDLFNLE
jgi:FMN phosphatase YigB (HAD superfamily)